MEFNHRQSLHKCCSNPAGHHKLMAISWKLAAECDKKSVTQLMCQYCAAMFNTSDVTQLHQQRCSQTSVAPSDLDSQASL